MDHKLLIAVFCCLPDKCVWIKAFECVFSIKTEVFSPGIILASNTDDPNYISRYARPINSVNLTLIQKLLKGCSRTSKRGNISSKEELNIEPVSLDSKMNQPFCLV